MRSIVHGHRERYQEFLTRLAAASSLKTPTRETLARLYRAGTSSRRTRLAESLRSGREDH